jgi:hypothetical protein
VGSQRVRDSTRLSENFHASVERHFSIEAVSARLAEFCRRAVVEMASIHVAAAATVYLSERKVPVAHFTGTEYEPGKVNTANEESPWSDLCVIFRYLEPIERMQVWKARGESRTPTDSISRLSSDLSLNPCR